ncbi:MAG: TlpA family protein disulfide reductase [Saprospiraceae bacterium]|nr:TlpA family protein disulfide reductase [Saprospiraceae bacterium]MDW8484344.1 TlpA disulfide reductase family protein [Saprospiraceae bacterium]
MKKYFIFCCLLATIEGIAFTQPTLLKITPERPQPGKLVLLEYDLTRSPLAKSGEAVEMVVFEYAADQLRTLPTYIYRDAQWLRGHVSSSEEATVLFVVFRAGDRIDNNQGQGYFIHLHDAKGEVLPISWAVHAVLYRDWGGIAELDRKPNVAQELFERAFKADARLKHAFASAYVSCLLALKRGEEGKKEALEVLRAAANQTQISEKELLAIARLFDRLGAEEEANQLRERMKRDYPKGIYVRQTRQHEIRFMTETAQIEKAIARYQEDFPPISDEEREELSQLYSLLANKAIGAKEWDKARAYAAQMTPAARANLYNNIAWELAEKGEQLDQAFLLAREATQWAEEELYAPKSPKPSYLPYSDWEESRRHTFAMYADTYALILYKQGKVEAALEYQRRAVEHSEGEEPEINERYVQYLEKLKAPEVRYYLEGFIMQGRATTAMKEQFKRLFVSEDKSTSGAETYLIRLEAKAREEQRRELAKKMIDQPAPVFRLKNLAGKEVSLEDLRGKIVVLDFWATWCGPCKASFPGMQKAIDLYKNDPEVVFLFIDTWENATDKEKNALEFLQGKGYTFEVLMDNDNQVVATYGVTGIPTKFVIDKQGQIRFKSVGFSGNTDALVTEMQDMIELVKADARQEKK